MLVDPDEKVEPGSDNSESSSTDTPEMVDVHRASIDDLDAAIANAQAEEKGAPAPAAPEADSAATDENPATTTEKEPTGQPATAGVATQGAEASKPASPQDTIQATQAENARLKKEKDEKELFIQHRSNELGTLRANFETERREKLALRAQLATGLEDRFAENPLKANEDRDRIKEIDNDLAKISGQEERAEKIVEAQTFFLRHVDTGKVSLDDVADMLKADGLAEQHLAQFKSNPWEFTTPEALVQMGRRAMDRKQFVTADKDRHILAKHVLFLNGELDKARKRPGQVMNQVQKHLNQGPAVTAHSASTARATLDPSVIPQMSIKELDAALKNATRN